MRIHFTLTLLTFMTSLLTTTARAADIDLSQATIVIRGGDLPAAEKIAPTILQEEIARRTGLNWEITSDWPQQASAIITISTQANPPTWQNQLPAGSNGAPQKAEGFSIRILPANDGKSPIVQITGFDSRGAMYGVGKLLRNVIWKPSRVTIDSDFQASEAPDRPLRGHQIGYRDTANSWDAWTFDQYDQYFREMAIFGANAVENIPFQEERLSAVMKYPRNVMNVKFAELCEKYDLEHWVWVPVMVKLPNEQEEANFLKQQEEFYGKIKRLDGVFVPGGDPGENRMSLLVPYLKRMSEIIAKHHPNTKIWLSIQHFTNTPPDVKFLFDYLEQEKPTWFGGMVMGPGSPPMEFTRERTPKQYKLRWYPDITHCVRCQYPIPWMDPAIGLTLGREPVNPRPVDYTDIYRTDYSFTDGFLTYSDGVHDDFNKNLWSQLGWNPHTDPREVARDYARFFFSPDTVEMGTDGLFALESDAKGPFAENGAVGATYRLWKELDRDTPRPGSKWRFRMHLFRACYAYFSRNRLLYETKLEQQALKKLTEAATAGVAPTLKSAREILNRAIAAPSDPELLAELKSLGDELFQDVGLQTSVPKYHASGSERGAILDFLDYPLNNRWWLEDQFDAIEKMTDRTEQLKRVDVVRNWENPGDRGYYDVLGHVGKSPRVAKLLMAGDVIHHRDRFATPTQRWLEVKRNGLRQAWHVYLNRVPGGIVYNDLDASAEYIVKLLAHKDSPLVIDGTPAKLVSKGETFDKVTEQIFEVPADASKDGRIKITWQEVDERHLNWRDWHYVSEIWVMKKGNR